MEAPLSGITILDLSHYLAGPYCTMILKNLGAKVIKIESPLGDEIKRIPPFIEGEGAIYTALNQGKELFTIDLKSDDGRMKFEELVQSSDVLIENFSPGTMEHLGYPPSILKALNPRLIFASVTGMDDKSDSQKKCFDPILQGMSGITSLFGGLPKNYTIADISGGLFVTIGILAALVERAKEKRYRKIDVSLLDSVMATMFTPIVSHSINGELSNSLTVPFGIFKTKDRPITLAAPSSQLFTLFCKAVGHEEWIHDPRFKTNIDRVNHATVLKELIETVLKRRGAEEWLNIFHTYEIPSGPVHSFDEAMKYHELDQPKDGKFPNLRFPKNPIRYDDTL